MVQWLLDEGHDINQTTPWARLTPLHIASQHGRVGVVRLLLQQPGIHHSLEAKTADARARPLHMAVTWGHTEVVRLLLEAGADATRRAGSDLNTPLHLAALNGFAEIVQLLLQQPGVVEAAWKMNWPGFSAGGAGGTRAGGARAAVTAHSSIAC
ncbi:hypothetical protein OEZ86_013715 [Tetradesmus obliquus]|nr:hypothetical protein OEZ86_013715 [Tetradesmus obliquus]